MDYDEWTREELEAQAIRYGISNGSSLDRSELIRQIEERGSTLIDGTPPLLERIASAPMLDRVPGMKLALNIFGAVLERTSAAFPKQLERLRNLSRRLPPVGFQPFARQTAVYKPSADGDRHSRDDIVRTIEPEPEKSGPTLKRFIQEPSKTPKMASILASQGHREAALAILEELHQKNPDDEMIERMLEKAHQGKLGKNESIHLLDQTSGVSSLNLPEVADKIEYQLNDQQEITLDWSTTVSGKERARAILKEPGELVLRIMAVSADPTQVIKTEVMEVGPIEDIGSWTLEEITSDTRYLAAVGLRGKERFVSIVHTDQMVYG